MRSIENPPINPAKLMLRPFAQGDAGAVFAIHSHLIVLDTNIVLDLFVFNDVKAHALKAALQAQHLHWLTTQAMRDELARVLAYPQIAPRLAYYQINASDVLAKYDEMVTVHPTAPKASAVCKDVDDQKFIDLAVAHRAVLISKDKAVLCMHKRLMGLGVTVASAWPGSSLKASIAPVFAQ
jgi:putative PIN family toxin of toxin-antitoxin system